MSEIPIDQIPAWMKFPTWDPTLGPCEGVYSHRPPGENCIWTVRWNSIAPEYQTPPRPVEGLSLPSVWYELRDVSQRRGEYASQATSIVLQTSADESDTAWDRWSEEGRALIRKARLQYGEATPPWCIPSTAKFVKWRTGWEGPPVTEFEHRRDGCWYWKGIKLTEAPFVGGVSRVHEAMAEASVLEARVKQANSWRNRR